MHLSTFVNTNDLISLNISSRFTLARGTHTNLELVLVFELCLSQIDFAGEDESSPEDKDLPLLLGLETKARLVYKEQTLAE